MSNIISRISQFQGATVNTPKKISERIEFVKNALFHEIDLAAKDEELSMQIRQQIAPLLTELETLNFHLGFLLTQSMPDKESPEK